MTTTALTEWNDEQKALLKRTACNGSLTDDEFGMFMVVAKNSGLDPFRKQIYAVKRWDRKAGREVMTIQVGIDGFRAKAARNVKLYHGQVGPFWCGDDGQWKDVWLETFPPKAAKVGVLLKGNTEPIWGVALWESYCQKDKYGKASRFWLQMGPEMLAKCAEALALRRALPEDLSGLYTSEEMQQAYIAEEGAAGATRVVEAITRKLVEPEAKPEPDPEKDYGAVPDAHPPVTEAEVNAELKAQEQAGGLYSKEGEPGGLTVYEEQPELDPRKADGLERLRVWPNVDVGPWEQWRSEPCAGKGALAKWTHEQLILGNQLGGRHKISADIIDKTRKKYSEQQVPLAAARLDYSLAVMLRRYTWEHRPGKQKG